MDPMEKLDYYLNHAYAEEDRGTWSDLSSTSNPDADMTFGDLDEVLTAAQLSSQIDAERDRLRHVIEETVEYLRQGLDRETKDRQVLCEMVLARLTRALEGATSGGARSDG